MAAKYQAAFRQYVKDVLWFTQRLISHGEYVVGVKWMPDENEDCEVLATVVTDTVYLSSTVRIYPVLQDMYDAGDYEEVAKSVMHEVIHMLTQPLADLALSDCSPSQEQPIRNINERQTQRITFALHRALPVGWFVPAKLRKTVKSWD